ncbi:MAG: sensor histidine kinase [Dehalococcoidia bacterium]
MRAVRQRQAAPQGRIYQQAEAMLAGYIQNIPRRLRERDFWLIQGLVMVVTALHLGSEAAHVAIGGSGVYAELFLNTQHTPLVLYLIPIVYASNRYGLEGSLMTGLWCGLLAVPSLVAWHTSPFHLGREISLLFVLVVVGVVLARHVELERQQRRRLEQVGTDLEASQASLRHYSRQITHAQEEERRRIARELHDDVAQGLVLLGRGLDGVRDEAQNQSANASRRVEELRDMVDATLQTVRRFSRDLRPSILDDLGLVAAMEWLTSELAQRQGVAAHFQVEDSTRRLAPDTELALFRIVQEALRNVEKHSGASQVEVRLAFAEGETRVSVEDNGRGFVVPPRADDLATGGKLGLLGMQERAQLVGAAIEIVSHPGKGTHLTVVINE